MLTSPTDGLIRSLRGWYIGLRLSIGSGMADEPIAASPYETGRGSAESAYTAFTVTIVSRPAKSAGLRV